MEIKEAVIYVAFVIGGLIFGSFLKAVIYRIPRKISIFKSSSFCPECKNKIRFYDNIPVLSYIILKGKCRNCKTKISFLYPLVEILTAVLFVSNYFFFRLSLELAVGIIFSCLLVVISFIDIEFRIIPNKIVLPFAAVGIVLNIIISPINWWHPLVFSAGAFLFMLIIHFIYTKGMGMGDVKFSLMVGAYLVKNVIVGLFAGFLAGSIYGLYMILVRKKKLKQAIPFGPFISLGSVVALFWGDYISKWYISFL
jgi:prepilin signal peptidase PulO-like enzyme (type II secretory pathway)